MNRLLFGDNLKWLQDKNVFPDASVDLEYLDPPFNSNANYNVLFKETSGADSQAQFHAFTDTWEWTADVDATYHQFIDTCPNASVVELVEALKKFLKTSPMMAYLAMMAPRLVELHRVLKPTGSLYLHCDPTASHYLRLVLDSIFGAENFRSEIVWRRKNAHNKLSRQYGPIHDIILFYAKSDRAVFHPGRRPYLRDYVKNSFPYQDAHGMYQSNVLTGSETRTGDSGKPWKGYDPTAKGRHWAIPRKLLDELPKELQKASLQEILDALDKQGLILHPKGKDSIPRYKQYLDSSEGILYQDIWAFQSGTRGLLVGSEDGIDEDVKWLDSEEEYLGFPTQKPLGLLERIINTSSNPDGVVLDPFCGCGTTVHAAQKIGRQWIGIDVTYLAINLIKRRLRDAFGAELQFEELGNPTDHSGAQRLAEQDKFQFQHWALSLVEARPLREGDGKGADRGVDGLLYFYESKDDRAKIIVQVKGGGVKRNDIATLLGDVNNQKAAGGVLITLEPPSKPMKKEAIDAGRYTAKLYQKEYPKIQILTVEGLLAGTERLEAPPQANPFAKAEREVKAHKQEEML